MDDKQQQFCTGLAKLDPEASFSLSADLYDLLELIDNEADISPAYTAIFDFIERHPDADMGNPGPLVHRLEREYPRYLPKLLDSLQSKPTDLILVMLNRVLNTTLSDQARTAYLAALKSVAEGNHTDAAIKEQASAMYQAHIESGDKP